MTHDTTAITSLLRNCGMYPEDIDFGTMTRIFQGQLRIDFYGGASTFPVSNSALGLTASLPSQVPVAVAVVNPVEIRTATLHFQEGTFSFEAGESFPTPGASYPATPADLVYAVAELLSPMLETCEKLALCLDFPLAQEEDSDCSISQIPPGFLLTDFAGVPLAKTMKQELATRGQEQTQVLVLNAAAATLLSGFASAPTGHRYLGLRWDQSLSAAFVAPESAVVKLKSGNSDLRIFTVAAGNCNGVPVGTMDLTMDRDSAYPGQGLLDKMVSPRYLGDLYRFAMLRGVEAGLLSFMCGREFLSLRSLDLEAVLRLIDDPKGDHLLANFCRHEEGDLQVALAVAHNVLKRGAKLVAAAFAAILTLVGAGRTKSAPALVSLSGSAFDSPLLRELVETFFQTEAAHPLGLHVNFHFCQDGPAPGAGAALLLNEGRLH